MNVWISFHNISQEEIFSVKEDAIFTKQITQTLYNFKWLNNASSVENENCQYWLRQKRRKVTFLIIYCDIVELKTMWNTSHDIFWNGQMYGKCCFTLTLNGSICSIVVYFDFL